MMLPLWRKEAQESASVTAGLGHLNWLGWFIAVVNQAVLCSLFPSHVRYIEMEPIAKLERRLEERLFRYAGPHVGVIGFSAAHLAVAHFLNIS